MPKIQATRSQLLLLWKFTWRPYRFPVEFYRDEVRGGGRKGEVFLLESAGLWIVVVAVLNGVNDEPIFGGWFAGEGGTDISGVPILGDIYMSIILLVGISLLGAMLGFLEFFGLMFNGSSEIRLKDYLFFRMLCVFSIYYWFVIVAFPVTFVVYGIYFARGMAPDAGLDVAIAITAAALLFVWIYPAVRIVIGFTKSWMNVGLLFLGPAIVGLPYVL